ncbi:hypothetical protein [Streptomyces sp. NBC_01615]|uniref:hypothetical protein n=1 Tax=Streptomyces sp. NBC_01615 TaxID=2975898 RepID=UPI00386A708C
MPVTRNHAPNPVSVAFVEACEQYGIPHNDDCNGEEILGVNLLHLNIRDGRRVSAWTAFVQPVLGSPLLTGDRDDGLAGRPRAIGEQKALADWPAREVADTSVTPAVPSGNAHAPTVMIGERCADFLLAGTA